jgi:hypothetical protein
MSVIWIDLGKPEIRMMRLEMAKDILPGVVIVLAVVALVLSLIVRKRRANQPKE